jgi:hypothetical protein
MKTIETQQFMPYFIFSIIIIKHRIMATTVTTKQAILYFKGMGSSDPLSIPLKLKKKKQPRKEN